jgi:hypothetical protein
MIRERYQNIYRGIVLNNTSRIIDMRVIDLATGKLLHIMPRDYAAEISKSIARSKLKV